jgi:phosphoglycolate phosphatase-like HAD superfamily hydrolase
MRHFETILFDLDGTLVDAFTTIHRSYIHTLPQFGLPPPSMTEVRRAVGGGLARAMGHFLPPEKIPDAMKVHLAYSGKILLEDVKALPGAEDLLRELHRRGVKLAVYTNKLGDAARLICDHLSFSPFLQGIYGAGDTPWLKPQREFTDHVLGGLGASAATTLLIGDSPFDVETARIGGFPCWCVTTGTHDDAQLRAAGAEKIFPGLDAAARELQV